MYWIELLEWRMDSIQIFNGKKTFWFRPCSYFLEWSIKSFSEDKEEKREDISHFTVGVITFMIHIMETALLQRKSNVISELPHTSATSKHSFWGTNSTHEWWMENIFLFVVDFEINYFVYFPIFKRALLLNYNEQTDSDRVQWSSWLKYHFSSE